MPPSEAYISEAFEELVDAIRKLATFRGHILGPALVDHRFSLAISCKRCGRWVNVDLAPTVYDDVQGITGHVLGACKGKPWGPPAGDSGMRSSFAVDAWIAPASTSGRD